MLKAVIFDFDGTIADTESYYGNNFVEVMKEYGIMCDGEDRKHFLGFGPADKIAYVNGKYGTDLDVDEITLIYRKRNSDLFPKDWKSLLFDDVEEALSYCREKGWKIYVCSNTLSDRVSELLDGMGILPYFDGIFGRDKCGVRKPSSYPYEYILKTCGYEKEEAAAIEDSRGGVSSARGAGIYTIGLCRATDEQELQADVHIASLSELRDIL